jgi:hypothetical protein
VCEPFAIPSWWTRWMSNDPGFKDWSVWYWFAADQRGFVYCYRERVFVEVVASRQAEEVAKINKEGRERPQFIVTGMDAFVIKDRAIGKTDVDYYEEGGLGGFIQPVHGAGARSARAKTVHEYLAPFEMKLEEDVTVKTAWVQVFSTCQKLITTLPALPQDENDPEAVKECNIDHPYDAFGYGLQAWHARQSTQPLEKMYKPGTAGDILDHAAKSGAVRKDRGPFR